MLTIVRTNQIGYIVSANQILGMSTTDVTTTGLVCGQILKQTSTSFTNSSLNGTSILYSTGLSTVPARGFVQAGFATFDGGTANGTFSFDNNDGGTAGTLGGTLNFAVASNGQATITPSSGPVLDLYLVDTNTAFVMDEGLQVNTGFLESQSLSPFNNFSISGNYFFGLLESQAVTGGTVGSGVETSAGSGTLTATTDSSQPNGMLSTGLGQVFTLTIAGDGRATDVTGDIYYIISPTRFLTFNSTAN